MHQTQNTKKSKQMTNKLMSEQPVYFRSEAKYSIIKTLKMARKVGHDPTVRIPPAGLTARCITNSAHFRI